MLMIFSEWVYHTLNTKLSWICAILITEIGVNARNQPIFIIQKLTKRCHIISYCVHIDTP